MKKGNVIFLNGTSSSGKTSIARALQHILDEPYLRFSLDEFVRMLPEHLISEEHWPVLVQEIPKIVSGMHHSIAACATAGNNIIVDHVLERQQWLEECVQILHQFPVLFVKVYCPLAELERRERERGDRDEGKARWQFDRVHAHGIYDVEVDTSIGSPVDCAQQIKEALANDSPSRAFTQLALNRSKDTVS